MLQLKNITKTYNTGGYTVSALKDVSLTFRENEFVAILGQSGSGKTTLLNIIGGLDRYDSGDLVINGRSTKEFKSRDWDTYRNHSIGFIFQSYNLIPHQTVLSNVELALTLSGVSKDERRRRAKEVLEKVGLSDQIHKKPNQMSGGQMQRVAIARALINDPDILLADEPTGALDSETSIQIMELLNEIAKDKLVIMVTHNPELADEYANRTINLRDGVILSDSNPYSGDEDKVNAEKSGKKTSMSFFTALSLSLNNLMTKKTRTILTSFAGSIGIIGIALILSLSSGIQNYITRVEEDTLSSYPLQISSMSIDFMSLMQTMSDNKDDKREHELDKVYSHDILSDMLNSFSSKATKNDLKSFKEFLELGDSGIESYTNSIKYTYNLELQIYKVDDNGILEVSPSKIIDRLMTMSGQNNAATEFMGSGYTLWEEMIDNDDLLKQQYDIVAGNWPQSYDEVVLVVNSNNEIKDISLYALGLKDTAELQDMLNGKITEISESGNSYSYDELLSLTYKLVLNTDYYEKSGDGWTDKRTSTAYMKNLLDNSIELKVVGIIRPNDSSAVSSITGTVAYTSELTEYVIDAINNSEIVKQQIADPDTDVFTGMPFESKPLTIEEIMPLLSDEQKQYLSTLSEGEAMALISSILEENSTEASSSTYEDNLSLLGVVNHDEPSAIYIYPKDFSTKEKVAKIIEDYNQMKLGEGHEESVISYTDYVEVLMSSITTIVDVVSYVLIAFVAISLIVSSIMIGIITYISVLERTKEIGILRAMGASKRDISRVFNAETLIVGFTSGLIGVLITVLLCIPINIVIRSAFDVSGISAALPLGGAIILVIISMALTLIAGLIPARFAAKKDPVIALRTE